MITNFLSTRGALLSAALLVSAGCASSAPSTADLKRSAQDADISNVIYTDDIPQASYSDFLEMPQEPPIKKGDTLRLRVDGFEEISSDYAVDRNGNVDLPLIGVVEVAGRDPFDVQDIIKARYANGFIVDPRVRLSVDARLLGRAVIDGAIENPQIVELRSFMKLSEMVALAGGLGEYADEKQVYLVRNVGEQRFVSVIDIDETRKLGGEDPEIVPGDIVFIEQNSAEIRFDEFLRTSPLAISAIALAFR